MTLDFNFELDKELENLLENWEKSKEINPESISQVLVVWNYWECYLNGVKESSNSFFDDGFEFTESLEKFIPYVFRKEVIDQPLLNFIWAHQKEKYKNQAKRFLN